jgi:DNA primase small subunit
VNGFSRDFVYRCFSDFYSSPYTVIPSPVSLDQRELGFLLFKEQIMIRHKVFSQIDDLKMFLRDVVPSDVYRSCAYYENPAAGMDNKGWIGADLVFDIDADHIPITSCSKIHDEWVCLNNECRFSGKGDTPKNCPACGGQKFKTKTWPCDLCLKSARDETAKLIDILDKDFGFSNKEMKVFFSGHRGYHVHVENEAVKTLDSVARKEIVDYIFGLGLTTSEDKTRGRSKRKSASLEFSLHNFGWDKRLKLGIQSFILNATKEDLKNAGIKGKSVAKILENKNLIIKRCVEEGRWNSIKGIKAGTWKKLAEHVKNLAASNIDTVVTTDTHRLIRMNGTLHGKTGLKKVELPLGNLSDFDPFREAVAFKDGTVKVFVSDVPEFRVGETVFGPYKRQTVELPTAAAVLVVCKDRAEVTN